MRKCWIFNNKMQCTVSYLCDDGDGDDDDDDDDNSKRRACTLITVLNERADEAAYLLRCSLL